MIHDIAREIFSGLSGFDAVKKMIDFLTVGVFFRAFQSFPDPCFRFQIHTVGGELQVFLFFASLLGVKDDGEDTDNDQATEKYHSTFHNEPLA
jgi:hypothetical protein